VRCKDKSGSPLSVGGDVVLVNIKPRDGSGPSVDAHVIDNTDGSYTCTYMPTTASANCHVTITVNGTHIQGSPFYAQVVPGKVDAKASEVFGRGLYEGMSGGPGSFTIQSKDAYGNRSLKPGNKFVVSVKPLQSLVSELEMYMRKTDVAAHVHDNEDGTHSVEYTAEFAGFYAINVTLENIPVGESPYRACVCNPTIAFPETLVFNPIDCENADTLPTRPSHDYAIVHDMVCLLKSDPVSMTGGRREREYLYYYKVSQQFAHKWVCITLRGQMQPPPARRTSYALDQTLVIACHEDGLDEDGYPMRGQLTDVRMLNLSDMANVGGWSPVTVEGKPPNAVAGYACAVWEGKQSIIYSGGVTGTGEVVSDIFLLGVGPPEAQPKGFWRPLAEWPSTIFAGDGFTARCNHSMCFRPRSASFWIFGGRDADGILLNDLHVFDMDEEQWSVPQCLGQAPVPRENHAACFVANRYLFIYGGINEMGEPIEHSAVYDVATATWLVVGGMQPRSDLKLQTHGGVGFVMGGKLKGNESASPAPLTSPIHPFVQASCMDFLGNNSQLVSIKPTPGIMGIRTHFTLEAIVMPRTFGTYSPIITRTDPSFKCGFGLVGLEHPAFKGDAEEGPMIHFFVGNWSPSGGGQEVHAKIEYDQWIHIAGVYNGIELRLYINGSFKDQLDFISSEEEMEGLQAKGDVAIGGILGKYAFDGYIDECRLWDCERKEDEIKQNMNRPMEYNTQHLLGQWTFNEGAGEVIVDSSGHRNHALFERYAGGVELRRVQSRRPRLEPEKSAREKMIDANFLKLQKWRKAFEERNGRPATKADIMLADPEIKNLAQRMGELMS